MRVDQLLPVFIGYCEQQFPREAVNEIRNQKLFATGYIYDHPTVCYFDRGQPRGPFGCIQNRGYIESAKPLLQNYAVELPNLYAKKMVFWRRKR